MIQTVIIGKNSNLSEHLQNKISNCMLISSRDVLSNVEVLSSFKDKNINIIFNNFQPATQLGRLESPEQYVENSIYSTAMILEYFKQTTVNKIIYTSSSSVYGSNPLCDESHVTQSLGLHSSLKVANEMLIQKFCQDRKIDYTIARVFNMYGGNDEFSIISKIINAIQNSTTLTLINKGKAIRDFIHIDNVVEIYAALLTKKNILILNIGTGVGDSIAKIIKDFPQVEIKNIEVNELEESLADNRLLLSMMGSIDFIDAKEYINNQLDL